MSVSWGKITAQEILQAIGGSLVGGNSKATVAGICTDSRNIQPGELFWAIKGEKYDGHDFLRNALEKGAVGAILERGYAFNDKDLREPVLITVEDSLRALGDLAGWWRDQHDVNVVAITGSAGKTTTKEMAAGILSIESETLKNRGNLNNLIGLPITLLDLNKGYRNVVVEMGMNHPGEIARLTEIANPDVGVITNVGMAHLEGVGNLDGVARAKVELVEKISHKGKIVLNGDDRLLMKAASPFGRDVVTFGLGKKNAVRAKEIKSLGHRGVTFDLVYQRRSWPVRLKVPGLQNVMNALAAAASALLLDVAGEKVAKGLGEFEGVEGRFMLRGLPGDITLVDDTYNANPLSLGAALESIESMVNNPVNIIVCLGEMMELGDKTVPAHYDAGVLVGKLGPRAFLAMGEHGPEMVRGAIESHMSPNRVMHMKTHEDMVENIKRQMRKGDLVFIKGSRRIGLEKVVQALINNCC
jgi:UDP-N-acetylmuramoyl-tripeptide--D-alanyl-D-alanine ligase